MIKAVEDAMLHRLRHVIGSESARSLVRQVESLPAQLDDKELERRIRSAPGAYVAFLGGQARKGSALIFDTSFAVYVLTASGDEGSRRRGGSAQAGAYPILLLAASALHNFTIKGVGSLLCDGIDNLFAEALDARGVSLYAARFTIPITAPNPTNIDALADFLRFHADWLIDKEPPAEPFTLPIDDADVTDDVVLFTPASPPPPPVGDGTLDFSNPDDSAFIGTI